METILIILCIILILYSSFITFIAYKFNSKISDLENFIFELNEDINKFKRAVDRITKSSILVYDDLVFDIMNECKFIKNRLDLYLTKYDEYKNYVYTEDVEQEEKPQEVIGVIRPGANG